MENTNKEKACHNTNKTERQNPFSLFNITVIKGQGSYNKQALMVFRGLFIIPSLLLLQPILAPPLRQIQTEARMERERNINGISTSRSQVPFQHHLI